MGWLRTTLVSILLAIPVAAGAYPGEALRFTLEPGVGALKPPVEQRSWGWWGGGASLAIGLNDQLWLQGHADRREYRDSDRPTRTTSVWAFSLAYDLDLLYVRPWVELGVARVTTSSTGWATDLQETTPVLGLGVDYLWRRWLLLGAGVRYYPLFETELLGDPGLAIAYLRVGIVLRVLDLMVETGV